MHHAPLLAAIDLGSNCFRLEISRCEDGRIERVQYLKEIVRQGNGLDDNGDLSLAAMQRGWECLARFAQCLAGFPCIRVRAIATQTLRQARNRSVFLQHGSAVLGHPIDVLSGTEEAQLVYQGVARLLPASNERRLVLDIGGRSTELILGQQYTAHAVVSFPVGSVAWSMRYFADGQLTPQAFASAQDSARAALEPALAVYRRTAWEVAYGSSGTVTAAHDILTSAGRPAGSITRADLGWLQAHLLLAQSNIHLAHLKESRRPMIGGGISVLRAVFDLLDIDTLHVVQGALRQGVLYELSVGDLPLHTAASNLAAL
jgi:exopolyphosphatase/guanosine-5'-triphosphate,3'-diphosphate pyrophosphatase